MEELLDKIRAVTAKDVETLPRCSYSRLEVFKNCPRQYMYKYIEKKYTEDTSLALELGTICHYVLEQKGKCIAQKKVVDYTLLTKWLMEGVTTTDEKTQGVLLGVKQLKKKYLEEWYQPDNASGMNYEEKMKVFDKVLRSEMEDSEWTPAYFEKPFEFVWDNKVIMHGFIDRIDTKDGQFRTVDYKTSKKTYEQSKLATSLQFGIYALAILNDFGRLPVESEYSFVLIDEKQQALTKGWEKRLIKALDKVFETIDLYQKEGNFPPKASPLCYWCDYCDNNPGATIHRMECDFYSKWTPTQKTFEVNKKWNALDNKMTDTTPKRKLIF